MPTRQAVWPADLIERRRLAVDIENRMRIVQSSAAGRAEGALELVRLQTEQAALLCPHWDVELVDAGAGEWSCDACGASIAPTWVQLADQEPALRRAARLRTGRGRFG